MKNLLLKVMIDKLVNTPNKLLNMNTYLVRSPKCLDSWPGRLKCD